MSYLSNVGSVIVCALLISTPIAVAVPDQAREKFEERKRDTIDRKVSCDGIVSMI